MDLFVQNANLDRVRLVIDKYMSEHSKNVCCCNRCVNDIAAIALNYLPPHYYVPAETPSDSGSPWVMIETAVAEAIDRVMTHPNHHGRRHESPAL